MATNKVTRGVLTEKGKEEKDADVNTTEKENVNVYTKKLVFYDFSNIYVCVCKIHTVT